MGLRTEGNVCESLCFITGQWFESPTYRSWYFVLFPIAHHTVKALEGIDLQNTCLNGRGSTRLMITSARGVPCDSLFSLGRGA
eukprot:1586516-Amphidinium_carterae.1